MFEQEIDTLTRLAFTQPQHEHDMLMSAVGVLDAARPTDEAAKREFWKLVASYVRAAKTEEEAVEPIMMACTQSRVDGMVISIQRYWAMRKAMEAALDQLRSNAAPAAISILDTTLKSVSTT